MKYISRVMSSTIQEHSSTSTAGSPYITNLIGNAAFYKLLPFEEFLEEEVYSTDSELSTQNPA